MRNKTRGTLVGDSIEIADTSAKRRTGLLRSNGLASGEGLWIVPCEGVHTFFMKFALDLVYLDRERRVRKLVTGLVPWRISVCLTAHSVMELPAGAIAMSCMRKGDELEFEKA